MTKKETVQKLFQKISNFVRKKESTLDVPEEWLTEDEKAEVQQKSNTRSIRLPKVNLKFPRRSRLTLRGLTWLKLTRGIAAICFFVDIFFVVAGFASGQPSVALVSLIFFFHAWVLFDYWRRTKSTTVFEEPK